VLLDDQQQQNAKDAVMPSREFAVSSVLQDAENTPLHDMIRKYITYT